MSRRIATILSLNVLLALGLVATIGAQEPALDFVPRHVREERVDVLRVGGAKIDRVRMLEHVEHHDGPTAGGVGRVVGRPMIGEALVARRIAEDDPA